MPHTTKRESSPFSDSAPAKMRLIAEPLVDNLAARVRDTAPASYRSELVHIDEMASEYPDVADWNIRAHMMLYIEYHRLVKEYFRHIAKAMNSFIPLFITGLSIITPPYEDSSRDQDIVKVKREVPRYGTKKGFSAFSGMNAIFEKETASEAEIEEKINASRRKQFEQADDRKILTIPIAPIIVMAFNDGEIRRNLMEALPANGSTVNLVEAVNEIMQESGKQPLGEMHSSEEMFQSQAYFFKQAFYDSEAAKKFGIPREITMDEFNYRRKYYTMYNRLLTSLMFSDFIRAVSLNRIYFHGEKSSACYDILERAVMLAGKELIDSKTMENTRLPPDGAHANSAGNKGDGWKLRQKRGSRTSLDMGEMFKDKDYERFL